MLTDLEQTQALTTYINSVRRDEQELNFPLFVLQQIYVLSINSEKLTAYEEMCRSVLPIK